MTLSMVHARPDAGVTVAEINLKFIWELISQNDADQRGQAVMVDSGGRLIAHHDINLVLRNTDLSGLPQVQAGLAGRQAEQVQDAKDISGREVLTAHAPVSPLGWTVFVDVPIEEAYAPLYASIARSGVVLSAVLALSLLVGLFMARRIVVPIRLPRGRGAHW